MPRNRKPKRKPVESEPVEDQANGTSATCATEVAASADLGQPPKPATVATPPRPVLTLGDHSVTLDQCRCYLGDTIVWRYMKALVSAAGQPIEHAQMLRVLDLDKFWGSKNDVRIIVYRLKKKLGQAGLSQVADCIQNVRGAYCLQAGSDFTFCATSPPGTAC